MISLILFVLFIVLWLVDLLTPTTLLGKWAPFLSILFLAIHLLGVGTLGHF